jgi:hypothetical protein
MHSEPPNHIPGNNQKPNIDLRFSRVFSRISNSKGVVRWGLWGARRRASGRGEEEFMAFSRLTKAVPGYFP